MNRSAYDRCASKACQLAKSNSALSTSELVPVRSMKIVRYAESLPSAVTFEIDAHELCHAIAAVQSIEDPCHAVDHGIVESSALLCLQREP